MNISFGQRIPTAKCSVFDTKENEFVPALICEYDCYDKADIDKIANVDGNWAHKDTIVDNMISKHSDIKCHRENDTRIYTLENDEGGNSWYHLF